MRTSPIRGMKASGTVVQIELDLLDLFHPHLSHSAVCVMRYRQSGQEKGCLSTI